MTSIRHLPSSKLLIPINLEAVEELSSSLVSVTESLELLVLGYWPVPEQSSPEQVRDQHRQEADRRLDEVAGHFDVDADNLTRRLIFSANIAQSVDDIAAEEGCDAILTPRPIAQLERILVVLREDISYERMRAFVSDLIDDSSADLTVVFCADAEQHDEKDLVLKGFVDELEIDPSSCTIEQHSVDPQKLTTYLLDQSDDYDLMVIARTSPRLLKKLVVPTDKKVARRATSPVIVVRHHEE